jgi:hypothetical protein
VRPQKSNNRERVEKEAIVVEQSMNRMSKIFVQVSDYAAISQKLDLV